jgi:hypothetical protein
MSSDHNANGDEGSGDAYAKGGAANAGGNAAGDDKIADSDDVTDDDPEDDNVVDFEEIRIGEQADADPLKDILKRASEDISTVYKRPVIEALVKLRSTDAARYVLIYNDLKKTKGFRAGLFNQEVARVEPQKEDFQKDPAALLLDIVRTFSGFRTDGDAILFDVDVDGHRETLGAGSGRLLAHMRNVYLKQTGQSVPADAVRQAIDTVAARIEMGETLRPLFRRVGADDNGNLYLDLHRSDWTYVKITPGGWGVCGRPALGPRASADRDMPVRFLHSRNSLSLPIPEHGGDIEDLRPFFVQRKNKNGADNEDDRNAFVLTVGWLLGTLHPAGPYPGLGLGGPPGSGKTTLLRQLRRLVDPHRAMARSAPRTERDLLIAAARSHIQSYDNLSRISGDLSDSMCRLSTGGGLATRMLYSDDEEIVFEACKPILLASIVEVIVRPDLADRFLTPILPPRKGVDLRPDNDVEDDFVKAAPHILGALLTAVSVGLRRRDSMERPNDLPRMAAFAAWVAACESGLGWDEGTFREAYDANLLTVANTVIEADPVAENIVKWTEPPPNAPLPWTFSWTGSAGDALDEINRIAGVACQGRKDWPKSARGMQHRLRTLTPTLAKFGVQIEIVRYLHGRPQWSISRRAAP